MLILLGKVMCYKQQVVVANRDVVIVAAELRPLLLWPLFFIIPLPILILIIWLPLLLLIPILLFFLLLFHLLFLV